MDYRLIGVIGNGHPDAVLDPLAYEVGRAIAGAGHGLVCGGLGGVMEAAARGCRDAGGRTVGILPGMDPAEANPAIEVAIPTGLGEMRNALVVRASAAIVAVGGAYGTLSEIALALKTKKPVVGLKTWDISDKIMKASDPAEAVALALGAMGDGRG